MKTLLKSEELIQFLGSMFLFANLNFAWWWFPALILLPDLSMMGYAFNPVVGAVLYNFAHHKGVAVVIGLLGMLFSNQILMLAGLILFAHDCMDRMLSYGLKYPDSFKHTSLSNL